MGSTAANREGFSRERVSGEVPRACFVFSLLQVHLHIKIFQLACLASKFLKNLKFVCLKAKSLIMQFRFSDKR